MPLMTLFLPGGQASKLQVFVSERGMVSVLADSQTLPLFTALAIFPLIKYERYQRWYYCWWDSLHLVLPLVPPPHVAEQEVHEPHGPTPQSTVRENLFDVSNSKYHLTRRAHSQIACVSFCERNRPLRCTFCSIVNSACIFNPEQWNDHRQSWKLIFMHLFLFLLPPPHVTVQELHDPHGPTSQSTGIRFVLPNFYHSLWHTRRTFNYIACFCFSKLKYWRHGRFFTFLPIVFCIHDLCPDRKILKFSRLEYEHLPFLVLFLFPSPQVTEQYVQAPHGPALQLTGL